MTILGCSIIFFATTLGATIVFFFKKDFNKKASSIICGFSAGVMISASIWGLLIPSLNNSFYMKDFYFVPAIVGILCGALFLLIIDLLTKSIKSKANRQEKAVEGKNKLTRFVVAFTVHNIPEGLAVGFAFGSAIASNLASSFATAMGLAIGIAIQNIPEGAAVALPVYKETGSKGKGFLWGMLSGIVEPLCSVIGLILASKIATLLPWFLSFSAGAMIFVSVEDLIPDSRYNEESHIGTWAFIVGFLIMLILDIVLG